MGLSNDLSCEAGSLSCCRPNPHGHFQSEVRGFISPHWSPGLRCLLCSPLFVLVYLCMNVGPQGLLVVRLPAPFVPHSTSLGPAMATRVLSAPPTSLDVCFFFIYLVLDFLAIRFSVSSGCARRRSVSTYAAILVLPCISFKSHKLKGRQFNSQSGLMPGLWARSLVGGV